jgi:hypothetical protein
MDGEIRCSLVQTGDGHLKKEIVPQEQWNGKRQL